MNLPVKYRVTIITLSDRASSGEYEDLSGPAIRKHLEDYFQSINTDNEIKMVLIPDEADELKKEMLIAAGASDAIFTTGGTGIGPRDITVETVRPFLTKEIPGVIEYIRVKYGSIKAGALLSCGIAGIINSKCLVYTLPGSLKAVNEYMPEIIRTLEHTFMMLYGIDSHSR